MTTPIMPFAFEWQYQEDDDGDQSPPNSLEIGEPSEVSPLDITIKNILTGKEITIDPIDGATEASTTHYHFKLAFNVGILNDPEQIEIETANWSIHCDSNGNTDTLYLLWKGSEITLLPTQSTEVTLTGVAANSGVHDDSQEQASFIANFAATTTNLTIGWQFKQVMHIISVGTPQFFPGQHNPYATTTTLVLNMVKTTGKSNIPLFVGFVGSNKVLNVNDGTSSLKLRITNTNLVDGNTSNITFHYDSDPAKCSQLVLMLEAGDDNWALGTADQVNDINISIEGNQWSRKSKEQVKVKNKVKGYKWIFEPHGSDVVLEPQDTMLIDLSNIVTSKPTGESNLYLSYNYVPGYRDGQFICAIEKSPLVYKDKKVGIGTNPSDSVDLAIGDSDTGFKQQGDGKLAIYTNNQERVRINESGDVGIGTTDPQEALHIKSKNLRIDSGEIKSWGPISFRSDVDNTGDEKSVLFYNGTDSSTPLMTLNKNQELDVNGSIKSMSLNVTGVTTISEINTNESMIIKMNNSDLLGIVDFSFSPHFDHEYYYYSPFKVQDWDLLGNRDSGWSSNKENWAYYVSDKDPYSSFRLTQIFIAKKCFSLRNY
jgi:hypothetical protein